ncbi:hypothetical protein HYU21_00170 [Candidatus Woesearchaeota archaeon]|nr:hypothetical protein [Candidatus Woesearchaeota archaeon]
MKAILDAEEKELIRRLGGRLGSLAFCNHFYKPELPKKFRYDGLCSAPKHKERFDEHLPPGVYFFRPFVDHLLKVPKNIKGLNGGNIVVLTMDDNHRTVLVSCNLRYRIINLKKWYMFVDDHEKDLSEQSVSVLNACCRGKTFQQWKCPKFIQDLASDVKKKFTNGVRDEWGISILDVYITHGVPCNVNLVTHDVQTLPISNTIYNEQIA